MSAYNVMFRIYEEVTDDKGAFLDEYGRSLPHFREIKKHLEKSFDDTFRSKEGSYAYETPIGAIKSGRLSVREDSRGVAYAIATIELETQKTPPKNEASVLGEWFDDNVIRGWGDCVFGVPLFKDESLLVCTEIGSSPRYGRSIEELKEELKESERHM